MYCSLSSKAFEEESSLLLPEVYDRYKLLLHKNDLNIVIDSDKDMSKLLHFTQLIFNMLKSVLDRALLCYVPKKKNLGRLIYRNDADGLGSCHSLFLANHRSSNQIALMEKENLKLTNKISSLITDDLKKNTKHESLAHAAQILFCLCRLPAVKVIQPPICASIHRDSDNYFSQICTLGQFDFFYEIAIAREGL